MNQKLTRGERYEYAGRALKMHNEIADINTGHAKAGVEKPLTYKWLLSSLALTYLTEGVVLHPDEKVWSVWLRAAVQKVTAETDKGPRSLEHFPKWGRA